MGDTAVKTTPSRSTRPAPPRVLRSAAQLLRAPERAGGAALVQPALRVGAANDPLEHEAERMADRIVSMPQPESAAPAAPGPTDTPMIARAAQPDLEGVTEPPLPEPAAQGEYDDPASAGASGGADPGLPRIGPQGGAAPADVARVVRNPGAGRALSPSLRAFMEPRFGADFSEVRLHDGPADRQAAQRIGARAFTHGQHIWMGPRESPEDRHLMAHELTHVLQQRGSEPALTPQPQTQLAIARDFDFDVDIDLGIGDAISGVVRDLLRRYAPDVEPVITRGPMAWLRDQLGGVFDGITGTISRLDPGAFVDRLVENFSAMVEAGGQIVDALIGGDCGPLFAALGRLKDFVLGVAGEAWNELTEFFAPVGEFFSELWDSVSATGAAALDWIREAASDVWELIEDVGTWLWDQTQPVRDYASAAWDWVKEQLFGPAEGQGQGDSRSGIIGWFSEKAGEAWDWVREQTRPVWEPVNEAVEFVLELIPPAFIRTLGEDMARFSEEMEGTLDEMDEGGSVAENREAVAAIIPSVEEVMVTIRAALVAAGIWLSTTLTNLSLKVTNFMTQLRASSIVSALASQLGWLETAVTKLLSWASEKVDGLFGLIVRAFDFLAPYLQRIAEVVGTVISVAADLLQLPMLIAQAAWNLIPECIREPIKEFVIEQVLSRIPVFNQLQAIGNLWTRLQETAFTILRALFVDGDILKAAWTFFREMLALIGLPARLVTGIITKAASALGRILQDPIGFLINTLRAVRDGFGQFFSNIGRHLMNGITGWLFGTVQEAGLQPPTEFSVRGVLGFVMQILDITLERVLARLALRIGQDKVDRIRSFIDRATGVWRFVAVLLTEGVSGLWEFVQERLSDLWSLVLNSVIGWITQRIIVEATKKLMAMLDPSGIMAVIESCIAIYRAIESFVEQLRAMLEIVSRVLDGINDIATGAIETAAGFLEDAMARSLPVAIAFLANQAGLGGLASRMRELVEGVREVVNRAIDWVIDKALRLGSGFLSLLERGASAVREGVEALRNWWQARRAFRNEAGEEHSVYIEGQGGSAQVMIASENPRTYRSFISDTEVSSEDQAHKTRALEIADQLDTAIREAAADTATTQTEEGQEPTNSHAAAIQALLDDLATETAHFMPVSESTTSSPPVYGPQVQEFGSTATVVRMAKEPFERGSSPSSSLTNDHWDALRRRGGNNSTYYVRGHLLNDNIGGPGTTWDNLTPLTQEANNRSQQSHLRGFETQVKQAVLDHDRSVNFVCTANYGRNVDTGLATEFANASVETGDENDWIARIIRAEASVPLTLDCSARELNDDGTAGSGQLYQHTVQNEIATDRDSYSVFEGASPRTRIVLNALSDADLEQTVQRPEGINANTARALVEARRARIADGTASPGRGFTRHEQVEVAIGSTAKETLYQAFNVVLGQGDGSEHLDGTESGPSETETTTETTTETEEMTE